MRLFIIIFAGLIVSCGPRPVSLEGSANPQEEATPLSNKGTIVIDGFASPESVLGIDTFVFVSNVGPDLQPMMKDGDGFISKLGRSGKVLKRHFIEGLDAPKGMAYWDSVLYIADIDKIKAFNFHTGDSLGQFDFESYGVNFLNDLCRGDSGFIYASATFQDKLYRIDVYRRQKKESPIYPISIPKDASVNQINGLWYDAPTKDLYIAGFGDQDSSNGTVAVIPFGARAIAPRRWTSHVGKLDGIAVIEGHVFVTDWANFEASTPLWDIDLGSLKAKPISTGAIGGPADFWYDEKKQQFWIPAMTENNIYITKLIE